MSVENVAEDFLKIALKDYETDEAKIEVLRSLADIPLVDAPDSPYIIGLRFFWKMYDIPPFFLTNKLLTEKSPGYLEQRFGFHKSTNGSGKGTKLQDFEIAQYVGHMILDRINPK